MIWVQALGWAGSALLVFSLLQARVLRFRVLNLLACTILTTFNAILAIWPMVAMNVVLAGINLWFIRMLVAERTDETAYDFPHFSPGDVTEGRSAYLVQHGNATVGVVVVRDGGAGVAQVELDYVTPRFRDFSPGEVVYRRRGLFTGRGYRRIVTPPGMLNPYYERLGFTRSGESWVAELG